MHVGIFDLQHVKVIWGHLVHCLQELGHNSKTAYHRVKQTKNIGLKGCLEQFHVGIFDLEYVNVI